MKQCCGGNCNQGRACPAFKAVRWPVLCTRCGSTTHYAEDCTRMPALGMCDAERDMLDIARRGRNCALGIIATMMLAYVVLSWIGGTGL